MVATDLSMAIPEDCYGRVAPRSGLALKHGIDTGAGVIDADYRGPVGVLLFNLSDTDFEVIIIHQRYFGFATYVPIALNTGERRRQNCPADS